MCQYQCLGIFDLNTAGHPEHYFSERKNVLDFRGGLFIHKDSIWGYFNTVITQSHLVDSGQFEEMTLSRPVQVDAFAWITSKTILYNCHICHHAIIGIGAVVDSITVPPYAIVKGNPAQIVGFWDGVDWAKIRSISYESK